MARRPGMAELAAAAGVSVATVDRLLNGREGVRAETAATVLAAARRLGHPALLRLAPPASGTAPVLRFGVVLHKKGQAFYRAFAEALRAAADALPGYRVDLLLEFAASQSPTEMAGLLRGMIGRCDVLAATAVNHAEITAAVSDVQASGVPVFALLSEFAPGIRAGYLGLDNQRVGRMAGWAVALAATGPGAVAVFVGGARWHGHEQRDAGFRAYLRGKAPHLRVLDTVVNLETRQLTHDATLALLAQVPDLRGIYVAGGGMEGAIAALTAQRKPGEVALVVNEMTPESRAGLAAGHVTMTVATPLAALTTALVAQMAAVAFAPVAAAGRPTILPPDLMIPESV
ncbi:MAG: LacI family DNA-binding transcriptional regulator [Paracoccaceae bacterium]